MLLCAHFQKGKLEKAVSPLASYGCRNANICPKRFATEKELSQYLEVAVFTSSELKSCAESIFQGAVYRLYYIGRCILCRTNLHWGQLTYENEFSDGWKLQMALTPEIPRKGLSRCVAEIIVSKRIVYGICHCCKI